MSTRRDLTPDVAALIKRTTVDRGIPEFIEDPAILARVAQILDGPRRSELQRAA